MSLRNGYDAPVARVFNAAGTEVFERVTSLYYNHSEMVDDSTRIIIETTDVTLVDHPDLQEGKTLKVVFGLLGSKTYRAHLVWIWDTVVGFNEQGVRLEIVAYCKAAYMKLNSSKDVFTNKGLDEIAEDLAAGNGLTLEDQLKDKESFSGVEQTNIPKNSILNISKGDAYYTLAKDNPSYGYIFRKYDAIPQKNASDAKTLKELAKQEPTSNLVVEGRDDRLIIKKRNLKQKPYKSYTYRGEPGYLLEFTPATRNTNARKGSVGSSVGGWDEETGEYFQVNPDQSDSGDGVLGDEVEVTAENQLLKNLRDNLVNNPMDQTRTLDGLYYEEFQGKDEAGKDIYKKIATKTLDATKQTFAFITKKGTRSSQFDFTAKKYSSAMDATGRIETRQLIPINAKEWLPTIETKVEDAMGLGVNRQSDQIKELNECTARVMGDPELQSGKIITIMGVGKKYSGNYYIISAEHQHTTANGYIVYLTMFKNGKNKVSKDDEANIDASNLGLSKNKEVALPFDGTSELVNIPIRKDR